MEIRVFGRGNAYFQRIQNLEFSLCVRCLCLFSLSSILLEGFAAVLCAVLCLCK
jgi:hypothetical protein